jgi:UDP-N-acetylmuramoyl-L-alanyl-D-glutamate--2,6-diaminopimelate ligase
MTAADLPRALALAEVAREAGGRLHGDPAVRVRGLTHDSRRVRPGMLFCALPGAALDGATFAADALARGAAAVLGQSPPPAGASGVEVPDARAAIGPVAHAFWGDPSARLTVVGVTGTNGKTTSSFLLRAVLEEAVGSAAALGTLGLREGERAVATGFTTPEAPELAELLAGLEGRGVRGLAMEVSSHALVQGRVRGVRFDGGVFTNLTHEHLDYHGTLEAYREAKLGFFDALREADAWAVVNVDDPSAAAFRRRGPRRQLTVSLEHRGADLTADAVECGPEGSRALVVVGRERVPLHVRLGGRFNVLNALGALAAGVQLGLAPARAAKALAAVERVPGRFELLQGAGRAVLIDYAHTPDAFERVLTAARPLASGSLTLIFGCGGERDREKRPRMGEIAGRLADRVLLTIDNPRREPLEQIMDDVAAGLRGARAQWARHDDRASAVRTALRESAPGDLVVLLGKGAEAYQEIGGVRHPYSDRDAARAALAELEAGAAAGREAAPLTGAGGGAR